MSRVSDLIKNQPTVDINTIISADSVSNESSLSRLAQSVHNLLTIVSAQVYNGSETISYDHDNTISHHDNYPKPERSSIIYASDLRIKKDLINSLGNDCICYADCTQFAKWKYSVCNCNSDCGCNYFSVNAD